MKTGKETDLIYEGIATLNPIQPNYQTRYNKETDLIYEGIATEVVVSIAASSISKKLT